MSDMRLDPATGDLQIKNFSFTLTTDFVDALMQKLRIKLKLFFGEYYLNTTKGVPYYEKILKKNPDLVEIAAVFKVQILSTDGVESLTKFEVDFDEKIRKYKLNFSFIASNGEELSLSEVI